MDSRRKIGSSESIIGLDGETVGDFWAWAYSDLLSNTIRPLFAEYLVGRCLDAVDRPRVEWDHVDFIYEGKKIEVKSAGYIQTWSQNAPSLIIFDISPKEKPWIAESNTFGPRGRSADCYVLCVHTDLDRAACLVNDVNRWDFYVIPAHSITETFREQKKVRLSRICKLCLPVKYADLKRAIETVIAAGPTQVSASAT